MIVITGAAGFIGSCMLSLLNKEGYRDIVLVDDFSKQEKIRNFSDKIFTEKVSRSRFFPWLRKNHRWVQFVIHLGARTDTMEFNEKIFNRLNLNYSIKVWNACVEFGLPLIYASSAATYGEGSMGYDDSHEDIPKLKPLNSYGKSKNNFDIWALKQENKPFFWAGFKFFNVYGPNEYHKGNMASVIMHAHKQIKEQGYLKLFRSHHPDYADGEQKRDFIYVKDVCDVLLFFMENRPENGIFNLGTGNARSFNDLAKASFKALNKPEDIRFVDTPEKLRDKYQYFTQANMQKLKNAGYDKPFTQLEDGIKEYVQRYLNSNAVY
ncbi:MAG: ADP-glyceromanno-heptose 6-epimerase [Candidatus Delongbacteria bacterium]|jgi:ADP-L-glycero-D-manno-heptose 6-epimerase|nr:ADP-glyceromanno-heptose 6-epimerase [Candidatus Delongbacteria bacterium]